jgi:hypothetical protein
MPAGCSRCMQQGGHTYHNQVTATAGMQGTSQGSRLNATPASRPSPDPQLLSRHHARVARGAPMLSLALCNRCLVKVVDASRRMPSLPCCHPPLHSHLR